MSAKGFVDTNILIYAHDPAAGIKHQRANALVQELWESGNGAISTQVLQELCVNLRRKLATPMPASDVRALVRDYLQWKVVVNTGDSVLEALSIEAKYRISFWDALILAAAEASGADVLYSEDLAPGRSYGGVPVVNPLAD